MEIILLVYSILLLLAYIIFSIIKKNLTNFFPIVFFITVSSFLGYLGLKKVGLYNRWMQEDAWAEWATFFFFAAAAFLALKTLKKLPSIKYKESFSWKMLIPPAGLLIFCIFVAGEELSWGQRIFGFKPPTIFLEQNYQQELNVHNFFSKKNFYFLDLDTRFLVAYICIVYGVIGSLLALLWPFKNSKKWMSFAFPPIWLSPLFAFIAYVELDYPFKRAGEGSELILGMVFLIDAFHRLNTIEKLKPKFLTKKYAIWLIIPFILGIITPRVVQAFYSIGNKEKIEIANKEVNQLKNDLMKRGVIRNKFTRRSYLNKRIYTSVIQGYLNFGRNSEFLDYIPTPAEKNSINPRKDRTGYFLDPWNNAYWIAYLRGKQTVFIYSFGPNRKRDIDFNSGNPQPTEDDISVVFPLPYN